MNNEAVPAAEPPEAYGRLRDAFERIVRRPADYGEVDALRSLIVGAGYIPPLSAKAEPVQIDRLRAAIDAERKAADLYGYFDGSKGTSTDYENAKAETDAALAAQPVTGTVEWEYGIYDPATNEVDECGPGPVTRDSFTGIDWEATGEYIVRRRPAGEWQEVIE